MKKISFLDKLINETSREKTESDDVLSSHALQYYVLPDPW